MSQLKMLGLDETSVEGRDFILLFVDLVKRKVLYVADGHDSDTVLSFIECLRKHNGDPDNIEVVTSDMGTGFFEGG